VFDLHARTEIHRLRVRRRGVDHAQRRHALAEVTHATVDLAQLFLAIGVLGVLGPVALGGGGGEGRDHLRTFHAPEFIQFGLESGMAVARDQCGAVFGRGAPAAHGDNNVGNGLLLSQRDRRHSSAATR